MGEQPTCCLILLLTRFTLPVLLPVPRWALTPPFHPYLSPGGIFSVALSIALRLPGVTRRHVLWSPDFPPGYGHPSLAIVWSTQKKLHQIIKFISIHKIRHGSIQGVNVLVRLKVVLFFADLHLFIKQNTAAIRTEHEIQALTYIIYKLYR